MSVSMLTVLLTSSVCLYQPWEIPPRSGPTTGTLTTVAGDYYFGDGLGVNCSLSIKLDGHFDFRWRGCLGVYDLNTGSATVVAGHLILTPERPNVREGFRGTATDFHLISWGDRLYLVPETERAAFCNAVNQGNEPRSDMHGRFHLRANDPAKKVTGLPAVPDTWRPLLLKKPLRGKVIEVLDDGRARIDIGAAQGAWKGMELWVETSVFGLVEVVDVSEEVCVIAPRYRNMHKLNFHKGQKMSSRLSEED
jgi:hypothetical protein